jgi:hypothetical protein
MYDLLTIVYQLDYFATLPNFPSSIPCHVPRGRHKNRGSDELTIISELWENARMIVLQSPAIVRSSSHRPCHSPSPGGSNERSECRFVCCSGVGRDEGELCSRGRQSALMPCPSGAVFSAPLWQNPFLRHRLREFKRL